MYHFFYGHSSDLQSEPMRSLSLLQLEVIMSYYGSCCDWSLEHARFWFHVLFFTSNDKMLSN